MFVGIGWVSSRPNHTSANKLRFIWVIPNISLHNQNFQLVHTNAPISTYYLETLIHQNPGNRPAPTTQTR